MKLIFINSCEDVSVFNNCFIGVTDVPLTAKGRTETIFLGEYIIANYENPLKIISSPLKRALYTARYLQNCFSDIKLEINQDLIEIDGGLWEDCPYREIVEKYPEIFADFNKNPRVCVLPEGESAKNVYKRAEKFVSALSSAKYDGDIIIIAHQIILKNIFSILLKSEIEKLKNGSITEFIFNENGEIALNKFNFTGYYLGENSEISVKNIRKGLNYND